MKTICIVAKLIFCLLLIGCDKDSGATPDYPVTPGQATRTISVHGFTIKVTSTFVWDQQTDNAYRYLQKVLDDLETILPAPALKKMQEKEIWLTADKERPALEYCKEEGPYTSCILINDIAGYYDQSVKNQPSLLIHYLALQYADRFLKNHEDLLTTAWQEAVNSGVYNNVEYFDGEKITTKRADALQDQYAYFAELSEAYWGKNDYFPFDYYDITSFDPNGFQFMETLWGSRELKNYHRFQICGFDVMVQNINLTDPLTDEALAHLTTKLQEINDIVPKAFTDYFKRRKIWMEIGSGSTIGGAAEYHPSREWLIANGRFVEKYNCVEIGNMRDFIDWTKKNQPMMILHELAHYYHLTCLDNNVSIQAAYETAMNGKLYDNVDYFDGNGIYKQKAYATTDSKEYFSEITEAYFGKNDYYPFVRDELKTFDPSGYKVMETVWNPLNFKE